MWSSQLWAEAASVLARNDTGVFTKPGPRQYPGQWNWDASLIALGLAHLDPNWARDEVRALLSGQWDDGMVPHIVFHDADVDYFPGPSVWGTVEGMGSVTGSGITQPPLLASAIRRIHHQDPNQAFLDEVVPQLDRWHRWFHTNRRHGGGLVKILHPWESGMDNSPRFDNTLVHVPTPATSFIRRDRTHVPPEQRPKDNEYHGYIAILEHLRAFNYRPPSNKTVFEFRDVLVSAILARAEIDLGELCNATNRDGRPAAARGLELSNIIAAQWNPARGYFIDDDPESPPTIAGLIPMIAVPERGSAIAASLTNAATFGPSLQAPWYPTSVAKNDGTFDRKRYWRGPVWVNVAWLLIDGLRRAGLTVEAEQLRSRTLELVANQGFWEYYDPMSGEGLGSSEFSWTAAVTIDMLAA